MSIEHSPARQGLASVARAAFEIGEFCEAHRVSRSKLYQMWSEGIGPRTMNVGKKRLITAEAAAEWRAAREAASGQAA